MPPRWSSVLSLAKLVSLVRKIMILGSKSRSPIIQTTQGNSRRTMHSTRNGCREIQYVRDDFSLLVSVITEAYGPDFFAYIQRNAQNEEIRRKYLVRTPEGYGLCDSTLRQTFNGPYILAGLEKSFQDAMNKDFASKFGRKAKNDLIMCLALKEKREAELEEPYTRPYQDIVLWRNSWSSFPFRRSRRSLSGRRKLHGYLRGRGRVSGLTTG